MSDPAPASDSVLDIALTYAAAGIRVLPIRPGFKYPPMQSWQHAATVDPKTIRNWFQNLYRDCGIGLAMGLQPDGRWLFALDIDEHDPTASGHDTLNELETIHHQLPETVESITGSGGAHILFEARDREVANGAAGQIGPGIDVRGQGGQIVVAPTIHPNGQPYSWEDGHAPWEHTIAAAPAWLLELVAPRENAPAAARAFSPASLPAGALDNSPADLLRHGWDWYTELTARGWQCPRSPDRNGDTHWTRPGKDPREGTSGTLHGSDGPFVVFTTDNSVAPMWRAGKQGNGCVSLSPLAFVAAYDHAGDLSAATRALRVAQLPADLKTLIAPQTGTEQPSGNSLLINWAEFWNTDYAAEEWIAWPLLPAGRQVALYAPAKTGKSIVTLAACAAVAAGKPVLGAAATTPRDMLYLDYEMTAGDLYERLDNLGYSSSDDLSHFHYALLPSLPPLNTWEGCRDLCQLAADVNAAAVIIDTMSRAVQGEENSSDSYREFARTTGLALKAAGRAVLRTDHAGKDREKGQRGSSAKADDVDIVFRIDVAEGGWTITRTHTRINWAPDKVAIERRDGDPFELVAHRADKVYAAGTKELADQLRALDIDHTATKRAAETALRGADIKAGSRRVLDALAWIKAEVPKFGGLVSGPEPRPEPKNDGPREPTSEPTSGNVETARSQNREPSPEPREPKPGPNGNQGPPLRGAQSQGNPEPPNPDPFEEF